MDRLVQCRMFTSVFPQGEVNTFLLDNPNVEYLGHTHSNIVDAGFIYFTVLLFYSVSKEQEDGNGA